MREYETLSTVLLTGAFGLVVAWFTWLLASWRGRAEFHRSVQLDRIGALRALYAERMVELERLVQRIRTRALDVSVDEMTPSSNGLLYLLASEEVLAKSRVLGQLIDAWSGHCRSGAYRRSDTGTMVIVNGETEAAEQRAAEFEPKVMEALGRLLGSMKSHLASEENQIR